MEAGFGGIEIDAGEAAVRVALSRLVVGSSSLITTVSSASVR